MAFDSSKSPARKLEHWPKSGEITIFDTEFTAWEGSQARGWSEPWEAIELVEIGAAIVDASTFEVSDTFQILVFPKKNPVLSTYFTELTGISQADLERRGVPLSDAVKKFETFSSGSSFILSNGEDADVFISSYECHGLACPINFSRYRDIQPALVELYPDRKSVASGELPALTGAEYSFKAHEALDDALSIAAGLKALRNAGRI